MGVMQDIGQVINFFNFFNIIFVPSKLFLMELFYIIFVKTKNDNMKIYQTTIKMIDLVPETNEIKSLSLKQLHVKFNK